MAICHSQGYMENWTTTWLDVSQQGLTQCEAENDGLLRIEAEDSK